MSGDDWNWRFGCSDSFRNPSEHAARPGQVRVMRELHSYSPLLPDVIDRLNELASGLEDPTVELEADEHGEYGVLYVVGYRPITDHDRERMAARDGAAEARDRAEYEALKARFEAAPSERSA